MIKKAQIFKIENDFSYAFISRKGSCGTKCETCSHKCHNNLMEIKIKSDNYFIGQKIEIDVKETITMIWLFLIYGGSLIVFFMGLFLGAFFEELMNISKDVLPISLGLILVPIYGIALKKIYKKENFYKIKG